MNIVTYSSNGDEIDETKVPCKCGTIPKPGDTFYYKSKYDNSIIEGIIGKLSPMGIISTKGVFYKSDEIELKPLHVIRSEKLNNLGI